MSKKNKDILEEAKKEGTTLYDFVITQKVDAFVSAYLPVNNPRADTQYFDETKLRQFFKAYVCGLGDPLALYVEDLKMAGFQMQVSLGTGEPCIFAIRKG